MASPRRYPSAQALFQSINAAAVANQPEALYQLARALFSGRFTPRGYAPYSLPKNRKRALDCYLQAARMGHLRAKCVAGYLLFYSRRSNNDVRVAGMKLLLEAAAAGSTHAQKAVNKPENQCWVVHTNT